VFRTKIVKSIIYTLSQQLHYHKNTHGDVEEANHFYVERPETNIDVTVDSNSINTTINNNGTNTNHNNGTHTHNNGTNGATIEQVYMNNVYSLPPPPKKKMFKNESINMYAIRKTLPIVFGVVVEVFLSFLLFLVITWNMGNIQKYEWSTPHSVRPVLWVTQLDQYWGMFAPRPPDVMWWYNIEAELHDGTTAELFNDGALFTFKPNIPHTFDKPKSLHDSMGNHRWFKLFENGLNSHEAREDLRLNFGRWLCREFNNRNFDDKRLYKYNIHWMNERVDTTKQDGTRYPGAKQTIWSHVCYDK